MAKPQNPSLRISTEFSPLASKIHLRPTGNLVDAASNPWPLAILSVLFCNAIADKFRIIRGKDRSDLYLLKLPKWTDRVALPLAQTYSCAISYSLFIAMHKPLPSHARIRPVVSNRQVLRQHWQGIWEKTVTSPDENDSHTGSPWASKPKLAITISRKAELQQPLRFTAIYQNDSTWLNPTAPKPIGWNDRSNFSNDPSSEELQPDRLSVKGFSPIAQKNITNAAMPVAFMTSRPVDFMKDTTASADFNTLRHHHLKRMYEKSSSTDLNAHFQSSLSVPDGSLEVMGDHGNSAHSSPPDQYTDVAPPISVLSLLQDPGAGQDPSAAATVAWDKIGSRAQFPDGVRKRRGTDPFKDQVLQTNMRTHPGRIRFHHKRLVQSGYPLSGHKNQLSQPAIQPLDRPAGDALPKQDQLRPVLGNDPYPRLITRRVAPEVDTAPSGQTHKRPKMIPSIVETSTVTNPQIKASLKPVPENKGDVLAASPVQLRVLTDHVYGMLVKRLKRERELKGY